MPTISSGLSLINGDTDPTTPTGTNEGIFYIKSGALYYLPTGGSPVGLLGAQTTTQIIAGAGLTGGGTLAADRTIAVANGDGTLTIAADDVKIGSLLAANVPNSLLTNAMQADMAQATFKLRAAGAGSGPPIDGSPTQAKTALAIASTDVSGLGSLATVSSLTGPVTSTGAATALANNVGTNAFLSNMAAGTIKGQITGGSGAPVDMTPVQAEQVINFGIATRSNNGAALTAATTEQIMAAFTIPANQLVAGDIIILEAWGVLTVPSTIASVITFRGRCGPTALATGTSNIMAASAISTAATAKTTQPWFMRGSFIVRTIGAGGTIIGTVTMDGPGFHADVVAQVATPVTAVVAIDTTQGRDVGLTMQSASATVPSAWSVLGATIARG